jgi:heme exporter protein B
VRVCWEIVRKDLIAELRGKELVSSVAFFSLLVMVIFFFCFELEEKAFLLMAAPGILFSAFTFAGMIGLSRSMLAERENKAITGLALAPVDRGQIYLGKFLANTILMLAVQIPALIPFSLFSRLDLTPFLGQMLLVQLLFTIGFCSVGTIFAAMSVSTRQREILLPILMLPIVTPTVVMPSVKLMMAILAGEGLGGSYNFLGLLLCFDMLFPAVCYMLFDYVIDE